jgi:hypothetical protein
MRQAVEYFPRSIETSFIRFRNVVFKQTSCLDLFVALDRRAFPIAAFETKKLPNPEAFFSDFQKKLKP